MVYPCGKKKKKKKELRSAKKKKKEKKCPCFDLTEIRIHGA